MFSETEHAAGPGISEILMAKPLTLTHPILTQEGRTSADTLPSQLLYSSIHHTLRITSVQLYYNCSQIQIYSSYSTQYML
eukprot:COSAG01_NODE_34719_length_543_cov_0.813063_1_plen_80_part_00